MNDFEGNSEERCSKPPVPKARPPLHGFSVIKENDFSSYINYLCYKPPVPEARPPLHDSDFSSSKNCSSVNTVVKENMYRQDKQFLDAYNDEISSDDDDDDENEEDISDDNTSIEFCSAFSEDLNLKSPPKYGSARTSPFTAVVIKRNKSKNTSDIANNTSYSSKHSQNRTKGNSCHVHVSWILYSIVFISLLTVVFTTQLLHTTESSQETIIENVETENNDTKVVDIMQIDKMIDASMPIIRARFYNQRLNIWNDIASGMYDTALYPQKPVVIILFGNEVNTLNCLAQLLGQLSAQVLGSNDYLSLTSKDFPDDVGQTIHNLKVQILQKRVVIIQDLLSINPEAMKAFHNFCDREHPLIGRAIYILTIIVDNYRPSKGRVEFIEKYITKKLSDKIDKDILDPLVTRLTDGVIVPVLPESATKFNSTDCSFSARNIL